MQRPSTVTAAFWLTILSVITNIVLGMLMLISGFTLIGNAMFTDPAYATQAYAAIVGIVASIALMLVAIAMRRGSNGARWIIIVLQVLTLIGGITQLVSPGPNVGFGIVSIVLAVIVIGLLLSRSAKDFFTAAKG